MVFRTEAGHIRLEMWSNRQGGILGLAETTQQNSGDVYSAKINGRLYEAKNELVQKKILPQAVYNKVKDRVVATQ